MGNLQWFDTVQFVQPPNDPELFRNIKPLYTAPPRKPWVGLNWDDIPDVFVGDIAFMQGAKWALAKLKEKNGG
jgi:RimJ/RimL family protein N-acetyltransferase